MRNIVGQTPRGDDFYPRADLVNKIYRRLEAGNHLFLSAPRRAGKTSIMRFLEDKPRAGYAFIYVNTEDIEEAEDFFKLIAEKLLDSQVIKKITKVVEDSKSVFAQFAEQITKIKIGSFELQREGSEEVSTYRKEFEALMQRLNTKVFSIIMLLDEFPVTLENIKNKKGEFEAVNFLHINRSIRQQANSGIQFVYTGSVGLSAIAGKMKATATLNDLNIIEIPPFTKEEAIAFATELLDTYKVIYEEDVIDYLLSRLQWLMPFFIQLVIQVLIDEFESNGQKVSRATVDKAFTKSSTHRSNLYFENYYTRLDKSLSPDEAASAKEILKRIANENELPAKAFKDIDKAASVLEMLELDGYINANQNAYRFNSPILRDWWKKYAN